MEEGFLQNAEAFDDFGFIIISADLRLHFTSTLCLYTGGEVAALPLLVLAGLIRTPISRSARAAAAHRARANSSHRAPSWATLSAGDPEFIMASCHGTRRTAAAEIEVHH